MGSKVLCQGARLPRLRQVNAVSDAPPDVSQARQWPSERLLRALPPFPGPLLGCFLALEEASVTMFPPGFPM